MCIARRQCLLANQQHLRSSEPLFGLSMPELQLIATHYFRFTFLYSDSKCEADVCQRRIHSRMYSHIRGAYFYNQPVVVRFASISLFQIGISFYVIGFSDAILCYFLMQCDDIRNGASHNTSQRRGTREVVIAESSTNKSKSS